MTDLLDDVDAAARAVWIARVPEAPGLPRNDAARIADEFTAAGAVTAWPAAGVTAWFGVRVAMRASGDERGYGFARLGADRRGFVAPLRAGSFDEETALEALLAAVRAGQPPADGPAVDYVRDAAPARGPYPVVATRGASAVIDGGPDARWFVRQAGARLLVIEPWPATTGTGAPYPPAGAYAELWPLLTR